MSVYKREFKNGVKWCVYLVLPDGKKFRKMVGTKKEAEKVEQKLRSEMVSDKWNLPESQDILFSRLTEEYLEYTKANNASSTSKIKKYRIEAHLVPYFGDKLISRITHQMVDNYKTARLKEGASPKTVNHELTSLSHMFTMSVRWEYIDKNVVSSVERFKCPQKARRVLNQEEINLLLEFASGSHIFPIVMTALHTGLRKSELFNLKWSDVDFNQQTVTVQAKDDWHTKNYKSRVLQMTPVLYRTLMKHKSEQSAISNQSEYVFTYNGQRIRCGIDDSLETALKKAGLKGVTLHTLRHTFASQLVMAGVPLKDVQELMGHRSFETTLQYVHLSAEHVKRQVLRLPFANG